MYDNTEYQYTSIAGAGTTQVFTGKGNLHSIVVNGTGTGGTVKIIDNTSGSTANVGTISLNSTPVVPFTLKYEVSIANGLRIITSATPDITVTWAQG